jgi:peptidyl-dipeptidase Dcp
MAQAKERNFNVLGVIGNTRSFVEPFLTLAMTGN